MGTELVVQFEIPVLAQKSVPCPALVFSLWFPSEEADFFVFEDNAGFSVKLWFREDCLAIPASPADIARTENVGASKVIADVTVRDVPGDLGEFLLSRTGSEPTGTPAWRLPVAPGRPTLAAQA
jgi:hypothetical protein